MTPAASPELPALVWNSTAESVAANWAIGCVWGHNAGRGALGESLYASTSPMPAKEVIASWALEAASYDYATNTCSSVCGHYTQLVWRTTTSVGCAVQTCTTGSPFSGVPGPWYYVVCNYSPPGNYTGQWPY